MTSKTPNTANGQNSSESPHNVTESCDEAVDTASQSVTPGRPSKALLESKKPGNRGRVGRPKGEAAIINEYKARMLASPKSARVLEAILDAALNDDHKNQAAAWKIVADRIMPLGSFDVAKSKRPTGISITITTASPNDAVTLEAEDDDAEDADYYEE